MKIKLLLPILALLLISPVMAYDFEKSIVESELPYEQTQQISFSIQNDVEKIYLTPSTSWIEVPNIINVNDQQEIIVNATIKIPEGVETKEYDEFILINNTIDTSKITFLFDIIDSETNITYEKTDLTIEARDIISNKALNNISLTLRRWNKSISGITNSEGKHTFQNIDIHDWILNTSGTDYESQTKYISFSREDNFKTIFLINKSLDVNALAPNEYINLYLKLNDIWQQDILEMKLNEPERVYVNNTVFEPVYVSKDAYYEMLQSNPENIKQLESTINSWRNQSITCNQLLEKSQNSNEDTNRDLNNCLVQKKEQEKKNIFNIIYLISAEFGIILLIIGAWFVIKTMDISLM